MRASNVGGRRLLFGVPATSTATDRTACALRRLGLIGAVGAYPRLDVGGLPHLAHVQLAGGLRKVGPGYELLDALAADAETSGDLGGAHQVMHGDDHSQEATWRLTSGARARRLDLSNDKPRKVRSVEQQYDWRPVPGWACWASRQGSVRGPSGQVLKPYVAPSGHLHVLIRRKKLRVHHAVLLAFGHPRPKGLICRHLDGDPSNNSLSNLRWGTSLENSADAIRHGRIPCGEAKGDARLTVAQVRAIRTDRRASRVVGMDYGVSHTAILRIRRGDRWKRAA